MTMTKRLFILFLALITFIPSAFALDRDGAISAYKAELQAIGMQEKVQEKAERDVDDVISSMEAAQYDVDYGYDALENRVDQLQDDDRRYDSANDAIDRAKDRKNDFTDISPDRHLEVIEALAGTLPRVIPDTAFELAHERATEAQNEVNRILLNPNRPGAVPEGDIVSDFLPQLIRQLFRFAWLAVLVALTVSGIFLVIAHDNEEKVTKAKQMLLFSMIGFAFIALAFALVKAVTDIDFFRFI